MSSTAAKITAEDVSWTEIVDGASHAEVGAFTAFICAPLTEASKHVPWSVRTVDNALVAEGEAQRGFKGMTVQQVAQNFATEALVKAVNKSAREAATAALEAERAAAKEAKAQAASEAAATMPAADSPSLGEDITPAKAAKAPRKSRAKKTVAA